MELLVRCSNPVSSSSSPGASSLSKPSLANKECGRCAFLRSVFFHGRELPSSYPGIAAGPPPLTKWRLCRASGCLSHRSTLRMPPSRRYSGQKTPVREGITIVKETAKETIEEAAKDIITETNVKNAPPSNGTCFRFERLECDESSVSEVVKVPSLVKTSFVVVGFLICGALVIRGYYLLFSKKQLGKLTAEEEQEARLMRARKIRARTEAEFKGRDSSSGSVDLGQIEEIRNMARRARLEEHLHSSSHPMEAHQSLLGSNTNSLPVSNIARERGLEPRKELDLDENSLPVPNTSRQRGLEPDEELDLDGNLLPIPNIGRERDLEPGEELNLIRNSLLFPNIASERGLEPGEKLDLDRNSTTVPNVVRERGLEPNKELHLKRGFPERAKMSEEESSTGSLMAAGLDEPHDVSKLDGKTQPLPVLDRRKPKIILSPEEARLKLAAKKKERAETEKKNLPTQDEDNKNVFSSNGNGPVASIATKATEKVEREEDLQQEFDNASDKRESMNDSPNGAAIKPGLEEIEWRSNEALKAIVFKVQANEKAGREPFHGLNSEQERLFMAGLEQKFEKEGERTKKWFMERVENLDYGEYGVGLDDQPEDFMLKWKDPKTAPKSTVVERFIEDRQRVLREQSNSASSSSSSPLTNNSTKPPLKPPSKSTSKPPSKSSPPINATTTRGQGFKTDARGRTRSGKSKKDNITKARSETVITGSGQASKGVITPSRNTKKWSQEFQKRVETEKNPQIKTLLKDVGRDLDSWITEEEIAEVSQLLSMMPEGDTKGMDSQYKKVEAKLKEERQRFGREAMADKYKEYKPEKKDHLWWLDLSFLMCIGVTTKSGNEEDEGLYCLDYRPEINTSSGDEAFNHVIAFEDRKEAFHFCYLLQSESGKSAYNNVEVIPYSPKQLWKDVKAAGFEVTVLRKGEFSAYVGQPVDEAEQKILQIINARHYEKVFNERCIDANALIDQAFGPKI